MADLDPTPAQCLATQKAVSPSPGASLNAGTQRSGWQVSRVSGASTTRGTVLQHNGVKLICLVYRGGGIRHRVFRVERIARVLNILVQ
jgi:hypothetical protein